MEAISMRIYDLDRLMTDTQLLEQKLENFELERILRRQSADGVEIRGHIEKAEHNLRFVQDNLGLGYLDWCITGCYYAVYHAALALILTKGYSSKNHQATLCILIKEYYRHGMNQDDIYLVNNFFLDYQDLLFYVESKNKREEASYSSTRVFDKKLVEGLRIKAILFVNKAKDILGHVQPLP